MAPKNKIVLKTKRRESNTHKNNARPNARPNARLISGKKQSRPRQHKYTKYYPSILDPNFSHKIATHSIFKKYKLNNNP